MENLNKFQQSDSHDNHNQSYEENSNWIHQRTVKLENLGAESEENYCQPKMDTETKPEYHRYLKNVQIKDVMTLPVDSSPQINESISQIPDFHKEILARLKNENEHLQQVKLFATTHVERKPAKAKKIEPEKVEDERKSCFKARPVVPVVPGAQNPPSSNQPVFSTTQANAQITRAAAAANQAQQGVNSQNLRQFPNVAVPSMSQLLTSQFQQQQDANADGSATNKALGKMDVDEEGKKKWKKGSGAAKLPPAIRKKRMNHRLSKILTPKNALILLHEFKPGSTYRVMEQPGTNPPIFLAHVEHNNTILASGQGMSKSQAKNAAAENAIKAIVSQTMTQKAAEVAQAQTQATANDPFASTDVKMEEDEDDIKDPAANLPWAGLASFAIYKMFTEWQNQGTDVPMTRSTPAKSKKKSPTKTPAVKKDLPPNAKDLHPSVLLNTMRPGIVAVEISRTSGPTTSVTMGYEVDGRMITGTAGNKKDAKREAAKAVITALYGLQYTS